MKNQMWRRKKKQKMQKKITTLIEKAKNENNSKYFGKINHIKNYQKVRHNSRPDKIEKI